MKCCTPCATSAAHSMGALTVCMPAGARRPQLWQGAPVVPAKGTVPAAGLHGLHPGLGSPALLAPALQSLVAGLRSYVGGSNAGSQPGLPLLAATPPSLSASQPAPGQRLPAVSALDAAQSLPLPQTAALPQHMQSLSIVHATQSRPASLTALPPDPTNAAGVPSTAWTHQAAPVPATMAAATLPALPSVPVASQSVQPSLSASILAASPAAGLPSLHTQVSQQSRRASAAPNAAQPPVHTVAPEAVSVRLPAPLPSAAAPQLPRPALPPASWPGHAQAAAGARWMPPPLSPVATMAMLQGELSTLVSQLQVKAALHLAHCESLSDVPRGAREGRQRSQQWLIHKLWQDGLQLGSFRLHPWIWWCRRGRGGRAQLSGPSR